uniref:PTS EIIA type-4 domain-containing protein n=1 Tax=Thermofilum pendens TaxID=2269 RepID=A0A7C3SNF2_THEPE
MKLLVAGHGRLGCAMLEAVAMILGVSVFERAECVDLLEGESLENFYEKLSAKAGEDSIIVADLFGGTPSRAALMLLQQGRAKAVLTGFNMPMLIEMLSYEGDNVEEMLGKVRQAAKDGVRVFVGSDLRELTEKAEREERGLLSRILRR